MKSIKEITQERVGLFEANKSLLAKAESEGRPLNSEERSEYDKRDSQIDKLSDEIKDRADDDVRKQRLDSLQSEMDRPLPRQTGRSDPSKDRNKEAESLTIDWGRGGKINIAEVEEEDSQLAAALRERSTATYSRGFRSYLRSGDRHRAERLGLVVGDDVRGGFTAPTGFLSQFIKFLDDACTIRNYATVLPPTNLKSVGALSYDTDYADADWSAEIPASDITEDAAARFGKREITPHLFSKLVKSSRKMLQNSTLAVESFVAQRGAYKCAITENKAYMTGSGSQRPLGMFIASADGVPTSRDTTCASASVFTADELIDCQHAVKDAYRAKGVWFVSRTFRKMCRKLKDGNGNYLMVMNTASGLDTLLERPLVVDENAPSTFTTGQYIGMFCDPSFYWIQDGLGLEIQRADELFALKNQVGWIFRKETDAMPVLAEAFSRLKLA